MSSLTIAAFAVTCGLLVGCAGDPSAAPADAGAAPDTGSGDAGTGPDTGSGCGSTLTYQNFGASFLNNNCNRCHDWTQLDAQSDGNALSAAVLGGAMPPGGGDLTASQRQQFADWITCGAP